jgi:hypothetical protein
MSAVVDRYLALSPRDFPNVEALSLFEIDRDEGLEIDLEMTFRGASNERLVVRCAGVRDLAFRQPFTSDMKLHSLDVRDVSGAQMELISFEVCDLEREAISFKCRTFEADRRGV